MVVTVADETVVMVAGDMVVTVAGDTVVTVAGDTVVMVAGDAVSARCAASLGNNARTGPVVAPAVPPHRREFVVDTPATMLRRNERLSKNARRLYLAMRSLADGRTGELRIGNRWLRGEAIEAAAEMCRNIRLRCMRELAAAGLVSCERERVHRMVKGRHREVLGHTRYIVYRSPVSHESVVSAPFLLQSFSSTVEEKDSQGFPEAPSPATAPGGVDGGVDVVAALKGRGSKSSPAPRAQSAHEAGRTTAPFLPCYEDFKNQFPDVTSRQFDFAIERILHRAKTTPCSPQYWQTSLGNFFANLAGETDVFLTDLVLLIGPDADLGDVTARLKDEALDRDLYWNNDIFDRVLNQARSRWEREDAVQSALHLGSLR